MNQKIVIIRHVLVVAILIFSTGAFVACEKYVYDKPKIDQTIPVSFQTEVVPIFTSNCISCHGGTRNPDLRANKAYESLTTGGYISTSNPESSVIYQKIVSGHNSNGVSDTDKQKLLAWITQGAENN
jgi:hypothetical protein